MFETILADINLIAAVLIEDALVLAHVKQTRIGTHTAFIGYRDFDFLEGFGVATFHAPDLAPNTAHVIGLLAFFVLLQLKFVHADDDRRGEQEAIAAADHVIGAESVL